VPVQLGAKGARHPLHPAAAKRQVEAVRVPVAQTSDVQMDGGFTPRRHAAVDLQLEGGGADAVDINSTPPPPPTSNSSRHT
jgi:hypothetical protein